MVIRIELSLVNKCVKTKHTTWWINQLH